MADALPQLTSSPMCAQTEFADKWKGKPVEEVDGQISRLQTMAGGSMKPELRKWLGQRLNVLSQIKDEL